MSSIPVDDIEPQDLQHEAQVTLQDIVYLARRYRAIYQRRYPHNIPDSALIEIAATIARIDIDADIDAPGAGDNQHE